MEKPLSEAVDELQLLLHLAMNRLAIVDLKYRIYSPYDPLEYMVDSLEFSIYDEELPDYQLLHLIYRCDNRVIRLIKHRTEELTKKYKGKIVSLNWLAKFCMEHGSSKRDPVDVNTAEMAGYYVYRHMFKNGSVYLGKGSKNRWRDFHSGRSFSYLRLLDEYGAPTALIIESQLNENDAYVLEAKLIANLRNKYGYGRVVNHTDGLENADIGDMPIQTYFWVNDFQRPDLKGTRYDVQVNLYEGSTSTRMGRQYYESMPLFDAAKFLHCTMNELLRIAGGDRREINGFQVLTDNEMKLAIQGRR